MARLARMTATPAPPVPAPPGAAPYPGAGRKRVIWLGLLIAFCAVASIAVVAFLGWRIGPGPLAVGLIGALVPVPVLIGAFLWLDRYQPSPMWILVVSFLWGAGVATSGALAVNTGASILFEEWGWPDGLVGVLVAPFIEELLKAAFPLLLFFFYRRAYTGIIDGIVYCGISATGFAMVENILYLGDRGFASGLETGPVTGAFLALTVFLLRVPLTGFAHPLFTSMTGIALGIAARSPRRWVRAIVPFVGLFLAMVLHGSWNLMAWLAQDQPYFILYGYVAVFVPLFCAMVGGAIWVRSWEGRLAERVLPIYSAAGWFSPPEVAALGTLGRRLSARKWAKRVGGDVGAVAMRSYQYAATRLALLRDGIDRGLYRRDLGKAVAEERALLEGIDAARRAFTGLDPMTPRARWTGAGYELEFPDGVVRPIGAPPLPVVPVPFPLAIPQR